MVRVVLSRELEGWGPVLLGQREPESRLEVSFVRVVTVLLSKNNLGELRSIGKPYFEPLRGDLSGYYSAYLRDKRPNKNRLIMSVKEYDHETGKALLPSLPIGQPLVVVVCQMIDFEHYKELKKRVKNGWAPE